MAVYGSISGGEFEFAPVRPVEGSFDVDTAARALDDAWHLGCTGRSIGALSTARSVLASAEQYGDPILIARSSQNCAWYCFQLGNAEKGVRYAKQAVLFWKHLEEPAYEAQALSIRAWLHLELGELEDAVESAAEALSIADQSEDLRSRSLAINVTGVIFWLSRQTPQAIGYCARAVELAREARDASFECWWLINLGGAHAEAAYIAAEREHRTSFDASIEAAIAYTEEAYRLAQALADSWAERLCLGNLAEYFNVISDFVGAEEYLTRYRAVPGDRDPRGEGHYLDILGRTLISLKRYEEALVPLEQAHRLAKANTNVETMMFACLYLSRAHENLGAFEPALEFHKRYHDLHQQFTAERTQHNARMAEIRYETTKLKSLLDTEAERAASIARSLEALQQRTNVLAEAANTDPLTGLSNRRRLEAQLLDINVLRKRYALAVLDVDHFKKVNDCFSHMVGDQVLVKIGLLIKTMARETDLAVRFGGEEFVLLLSDVTLAQARKACERLRSKIEKHDWSQISAVLRVTVSIGVAVSDDAPDAQSVMALADSYLYCAKQAGRNRVVSHNP